MTMLTKPDEPLVTHIYTADTSTHIYEDKIYIYPSHDINNNGEALNMKDVPWAGRQMWAPDAAYKNGVYYMYFPARDKKGIFRIGVATSSNPAGPFTAKPDYIKGSYSIDPAVLVDDDNKAYMYFGGLWGGQLDKWRNGNFIPNALGPDSYSPAVGPRAAQLNEDMVSFKEEPQEILILDERGNPILAGDEERRYFEDPWIHKYKGLYYLSYSTGTTHYIVYATARNPKGPFIYKGSILNPVIGWTTHHSIVQFTDKWYLFYHDSSLSGGVNHKHCVKYTELKYNADGTIRTIDPCDY